MIIGTGENEQDIEENIKNKSKPVIKKTCVILVQSMDDSVTFMT